MYQTCWLSADVMWIGGIYNLIQMPVSSMGVFALILLILRGHISGLIIGILYWIMGYIANPFWLILPTERSYFPL
jgi:hypothetical protein